MRLLDKALDIAKQSNQNKQFFFGCVAKRDDGAIVYSVNHCVRSQKVPSHHAESRCARKCDVDSIIYVARVLRDRKTPANAKPCNFCQSFIINRGIKRVYYTIDQNHYGIWGVQEGSWKELLY